MEPTHIVGEKHPLYEFVFHVLSPLFSVSLNLKLWKKKTKEWAKTYLAFFVVLAYNRVSRLQNNAV